jgi:acyl-CoA thioesterase
MTLLEETREKFKQDRYATEVTGAEIIAVDKGYAKTQLKIEPRHRNVVGGVMGGAMFTLADFAFAIASNTGYPETISISSDIEFLNAVKGSVLTAETHCERAGRRTCTYRIPITDDLGTRVAVVMMTGLRVGK